jgi:hypothetical protein
VFEWGLLHCKRKRVRETVGAGFKFKHIYQKEAVVGGNYMLYVLTQVEHRDMLHSKHT